MIACKLEGTFPFIFIGATRAISDDSAPILIFKLHLETEQEASALDNDRQKIYSFV